MHVETWGNLVSISSLYKKIVFSNFVMMGKVMNSAKQQLKTILIQINKYDGMKNKYNLISSYSFVLIDDRI